MGRTAYGVRGISLREDDEVVAMEVLQPGGTILSVTEQGYGKRTELDEYRVQSRGGIGIINIQTSERNGKVVGIAQVTDDDELMLITQQGKILRMASKDIRTIGRATQGVRLIDIEGRRPRRVDRAAGREGTTRSRDANRRRRRETPAPLDGVLLLAASPVRLASSRRRDSSSSTSSRPAASTTPPCSRAWPTDAVQSRHVDGVVQDFDIVDGRRGRRSGTRPRRGN